MTFVARDFREAIDQGNIALVEAILNERDKNTGIPLVDINNISNNPHLRTALNYTLGSRSVLLESSARYEIALRILSVSDHQRNPVIDLNVPNGLGGTSFSWLQSRAIEGAFSPPHVRALSQRILNLRHPDGSRVFDFNADTSTEGLLVHSVLQGDPFIVNELVDLREADGRRALQINRTYNWDIGGLGWSASTALDVALRGSYFRIIPEYIPNQQIVRILRENGGITAAELNGQRDILREIPAPALPVRVIPQAIRNNNINQFNADRQNVHDANVENSVNSAIVSLCLKYYAPGYFEGCSADWKRSLQNTFRERLEEIRAYIATCERSREQKERIERGFRYITEMGFSEHALTHLELKEVLALIWTAASDLSAPDPTNEDLDRDILVKLRKEAIFDQIYEAEITYGTGDRDRSCLGGYRNRLIISLNKAHECVQIILLGSEAMSMAVDCLKFWIKRELLNLPLHQQKAILKSWSEMDEETQRASNPAYQFHSNDAYLQKLQTLTKNTFPLTIQQRWSLFNPQYWCSFQRPALYAPLDLLIQKIVQIPILEAQSPRGRLIAYIQKSAKNAFEENRSYEEDHRWLDQQYTIYCKIKSCLEALEQCPPALLSFKAQIETEIIFSSELTNCIQTLHHSFQQFEPENSWENILKNIFMVCLPIIGWLYLLYRFFQEEELFFRTSDQKFYSHLQRAIF